MRIFVTGATGFVGSAVVQDLLSSGHSVLGLVRSDEGAAALAATGAEVHRGALDDLDSLRRGASATDGTIHTAFVRDFTRLPAAGETDRLAIEAMGEALANSGRPLIVTSGTAHLAPGRVGTEDDAPDPQAAAKHRVASEVATLALAARGVRTCVLRLPPSVHGDGDHGFVPALIGIARAKGVSAYVGDGSNRWPAVHRLDAARLFRLAVESAAAGMRVHGVAETGIPVRDIAEVIGRRLNLPVMSKSPEEARRAFRLDGALRCTRPAGIECADTTAIGLDADARDAACRSGSGCLFPQLKICGCTAPNAPSPRPPGTLSAQHSLRSPMGEGFKRLCSRPAPLDFANRQSRAFAADDHADGFCILTVDGYIDRSQIVGMFVRPIE